MYVYIHSLCHPIAAPSSSPSSLSLLTSPLCATNGECTTAPKRLRLVHNLVSLFIFMPTYPLTEL
jgi:hypothetical protein